LILEPAGKDSARFRLAGAQEVMVASPYRYAIAHELRGAPEPALEEQWVRLAPADLTLVEGFKQAPIPRMEVYRPSSGLAPLYPDDPGFMAVVSDVELGGSLPCLPLNDPPCVAAFICKTLGVFLPETTGR